jgi:hypothetical protein
MATFSKLLICSTSISRAGLMAAEPSSGALKAITRQIHKALMESARWHDHDGRDRIS